MATTKKTPVKAVAKKAPAPTAKRSKAAEPVPAPEAKVAKAVAPKAEKVAPKIATPTGEFFYAAGNRKTCVARVRLYEKGTGLFTVNGKKLEEYIVLASKRDSIKAPLRITGQLKTFDISVVTSGGGLNGQADAIRHGISKALLEFDPSLRITLKRAGFLTRDPRMKERKKYGLHRARRAPQWSKR